MNEYKEETFSPAIREAILRRDSYKCVVCGMGAHEGVKIDVVRIIPNEGSTSDNAWTLCETHKKANMYSTDSGKQMFTQMLKTSAICGNTKLSCFASDMLSVYEKHHVGYHIEWKN